MFRNELCEVKIDLTEAPFDLFLLLPLLQSPFCIAHVVTDVYFTDTSSLVTFLSFFSEQIYADHSGYSDDDVTDR